MAAALQLLKSISRRRQERHDLEMQMLVTQKSESRKRKLQMMEDDEIDKQTFWVQESPKLMQIQFGRLREQMQTP